MQTAGRETDPSRLLTLDACWEVVVVLARAIEALESQGDRSRFAADVSSPARWSKIL
jgi:hypothetical protein